MDLAIGTSTENPPTPRSFSENHKFLTILYDVLSEHAADDPLLQSQAQAFAGPGGMTFGAGGGGFQHQSRRRSSSSKPADSGAGGASAQGGAGGAGVGGHVHLSDLRNPPDFGRIAVSNPPQLPRLMYSDIRYEQSLLFFGGPGIVLKDESSNPHSRGQKHAWRKVTDQINSGLRIS